MNRDAAAPAAPNALWERVERSLSRIRPALVADGGDVELVSIQEGVVRVKLLGACCGCPFAPLTLKAGIEDWLRRDVPEVLGVEAVHARA